GTGLGLSICKKLVDIMGGELKVDSKVGTGTNFHFTVKLGKSQVTSTPVKVRKVAKASLNLKVLLVEDNQANQEIAKGFLNRWGVEVDVANNGEVAIEKIKSKVYHLMLIDVRMPVMDGYEATKRIRAMKDHYFKEIPIIALTASTLAESRYKMEKSGMDEIVSKPFDPDDLFEKVSRLGRKSVKKKKVKVAEMEESKGSYFKFLTEVLGDDNDKVMMIATMAIKSINDDLRGSRDSLPAQDREKTYNYLHKMKSNLANVDQKDLAGRMPDYKSEDFWEKLPSFLDEVEEEIEKLQIHLV
ncbi:MAG: response regulator, partial [Ekhidna sp.]